MIVHTGTVICFDSKRGFGFLSSTSSGIRKLFFHRNDLINVVTSEIETGQALQFEIVETVKGPEARRIRAVTPYAEAS